MLGHYLLALAALGCFADASEVIYAVDSDYLALYQKQSSLPIDIGYGVFAKVDIPAGEIICEYRGPTIDATTPHYSNKKFRTRVLQNPEQNIIGDTICSMINDCVLISGANYTMDDVETFKACDREDCIPTYPGFAYNAGYTHTALGKVFIYAKTPIPADTEIFFPYGRYF